MKDTLLPEKEHRKRRHDAIEPDRMTLEHAGVELHTLHVSQTPDLEAWTASDSERHWEIDTNAILENQFSVL